MTAADVARQHAATIGAIEDEMEVARRAGLDRLSAAEAAADTAIVEALVAEIRPLVGKRRLTRKGAWVDIARGPSVRVDRDGYYVVDTSAVRRDAPTLREALEALPALAQAASREQLLHADQMGVVREMLRALGGGAA